MFILVKNLNKLLKICHKMKEHKNFNTPEKGFEDFETNLKALKKNQSSQTFFKIKKTNFNFNSNHYRTKTMTSEKVNSMAFGKNKNEILGNFFFKKKYA